MTSVELWRELLEGGRGPRPLVDLGSTALSGARAFPDPRTREGQLAATDCARLGLRATAPGPAGSDLPPHLVDHLLEVTKWSGLESPLAHARAAEVRCLPQPAWGVDLDRPGDRADAQDALVVIADAPSPGLFDLCAALRGRWRFLEDVAAGAPIVEELLDWSFEYVRRAYTHLLSAAVQPDLVLYGDDLATGHGPLLSPPEFRRWLAPRLRELFAAFGPGDDVPVLLHSCGDVRPLLDDLLDLPIRAISVDAALLGGVAALRRTMPSDLILYGITPLVRLGALLRRGDRAGAHELLEQADAARPLIAADEEASPRTLRDAARAAEVLMRAQWIGIPCGPPAIAPEHGGAR